MSFYGNSLPLHHIAKDMTNFLTAFCLTILFCNCNTEQTKTNSDNSTKVQTKDTTNYKSLQGTWVRHNKEGFTLIEIKDTSNILYYQFVDRKVYIDTISNDNRYVYFKSKAKMGYWNNPKDSFKADVDIWIHTDKFRVDYKLKGDTLIEIDKMGEQGKLIKVNNDNNDSY